MKIIIVLVIFLISIIVTILGSIGIFQKHVYKKPNSERSVVDIVLIAIGALGIIISIVTLILFSAIE